MVDDKYREALNQAKAEFAQTREALGELHAQQEEKEKRLVELREFMVATSKMLGEECVIEDEDGLGLTDAVRKAYKTSSVAISHVGVEKHFDKIGYDLSKYGSPASATASIHKVVSRLFEKGEIVSAGVNSDGRAVYRWAGLYGVTPPANRRPIPSLPTPTPPADFKPTLGTPDPLNQRGKNVPLTAGEAKRMMEGLKPKK